MHATMAQVRALAWSIFWKWLVVAGIAGLVAGLGWGFLMALISRGWSYSMQYWVLTIGGWIIGLTISFYVFNYFFAQAIGTRMGGRTLKFEADPPFAGYGKK